MMNEEFGWQIAVLISCGFIAWIIYRFISRE